MRKNYFYILFILLFGMFSCSQEDEQLMEAIAQDDTNPELRAADGKFRMLGFSYDVTGENLDRRSIRRAVVDVERLANNNKFSVVVNPETGGINKYYYGYDALDYLKEVSRKTGFEATAEGGALGKLNLTGFGGNISYNYDTSSKYSYSSKYSFASAEIKKFQKSFAIEENAEFLKKYLTDKFVRDVNNINAGNASQFVLDYGTHVLMDIIIGGHISVVYKSSIVEVTDSSSRKQVIKAGINGTIKKIALTADYDKETQIDESLSTKNMEVDCRIYYKAGAGVDFAFNPDKTQIVEKSKWEASVTDQNSGLVEVDWSKAIPIHEFISDPVKKAEVKLAVENYIASKKLEVLPLKPLYRLQNDWGHFHHTIKPWMGVGAKVNEWRNLGVIAYVFEKPYPGLSLIPLYIIQHPKKGTVYLSTGANDPGSMGIHCYTLRNQLPETAPLYKIYHSRDVNHIYTVYPEFRDQVLYVWKGWVNQGGIGYAYPGSYK